MNRQALDPGLSCAALLCPLTSYFSRDSLGWTSIYPHPDTTDQVDRGNYRTLQVCLSDSCVGYYEKQNYTACTLVLKCAGGKALFPDSGEARLPWAHYQKDHCLWYDKDHNRRDRCEISLDCHLFREPMESKIQLWTRFLPTLPTGPLCTLPDGHVYVGYVEMRVCGSAQEAAS